MVNVAEPGKATAITTALGWALALALLGLGYLALAWIWDSIFGGGFFSLVGAIRGGAAGAAKIEVDRDALTMVILAPVATGALVLATLGDPIATRLRLDTVPALKAVGYVLGLAAFFAVVVTSSALSEMAVARIMASRHYTPCAALDRHVGSGRTAIYYETFVMHAADCPAPAS